MSLNKNLEFEKSSFLNKSNSTFIEEMYVRYINKDPELPKSWKEYFDDLGEEIEVIANEIKGPSWNPLKKIKIKDISENIHTLVCWVRRSFVLRPIRYEWRRVTVESALSRDTGGCD